MIIQKNKGSNIKFIGYTLRQWTLLFSLIFFIFTAIFITLSILGLLKSEYGWKLIKVDIVEEESKSKVYSNHNEISSNEKKLCESVQSELMKICVFYLCSWTGVLNLITVICLLYGVITKNHAYILPWVIVSLVTFGMTLFTILFMHHNNLNEVSTANVVIGIASMGIFVGMWNTIFLYFKTLMESYHKKHLSSTVIKAYGGYTHSLKSVT